MEIIAILIAMFVFWRKLRAERVSNEDGLMDKAALAFIVALTAGRVVYLLFHINEFVADVPRGLVNWLDGDFIQGVAVVLYFKFFEKWIGPLVRDSVEVADYMAIAVAAFMFMASLFNLVKTLVLWKVSNLFSFGEVIPILSAQTLIVAFGVMIAYGVMWAYLENVEKKYRTFLWYRSKRHSAQTGFIVASFLIGYGFIGFISGILSPKLMRLFTFGIDPFLYLLVMVGGVVLLYIRSGRPLFERRRV